MQSAKESEHTPKHNWACVRVNANIHKMPYLQILKEFWMF